MLLTLQLRGEVFKMAAKMTYFIAIKPVLD